MFCLPFTGCVVFTTAALLQYFACLSQAVLPLQLPLCYNVLLAFHRLCCLYNCHFVTMFYFAFHKQRFCLYNCLLINNVCFSRSRESLRAPPCTRLKRVVFFVKKTTPLRIPQKKLLVMCCKAAISAQLEIQVLTTAFHVESVLLNPAYAG